MDKERSLMDSALRFDALPSLPQARTIRELAPRADVSRRHLFQLADADAALVYRRHWQRRPARAVHWHPRVDRVGAGCRGRVWLGAARALWFPDAQPGGDCGGDRAVSGCDRRGWPSGTASSTPRSWKTWSDTSGAHSAHVLYPRALGDSAHALPGLVRADAGYWPKVQITIPLACCALPCPHALCYSHPVQ